MNYSCTIIILLLCICCSESKNELVKSSEASFRITLNQLRDLTEAEIDSIEHTKPFYIGRDEQNILFKLLEKKIFVSDMELDTSGLNFTIITWEKPIIDLEELNIELDISPDLNIDRLFIKRENKIQQLDLGNRLLGDRFISYLDLDDDGKKDLLIMDKYYLIGGYNFDLKYYTYQ